MKVVSASPIQDVKRSQSSTLAMYASHHSLQSLWNKGTVVIHDLLQLPTLTSRRILSSQRHSQDRTKWITPATVFTFTLLTNSESSQVHSNTSLLWREKMKWGHTSRSKHIYIENTCDILVVLTFFVEEPKCHFTAAQVRVSKFVYAMAFLAATRASTWIHLHSTTRRVHTKLTIYSSSYRFYNQQWWPPHHEVHIQSQEQLNAYPPSTFDKLYFGGHVHTWCYQNCDPHSFNEHKQMIPLLFCCWFKLVLLAINYLCLLLLWMRSGRSSMKQYIPLKPTKRRFKVWVRADEVTGYFWHLSWEIIRWRFTKVGIGERMVCQLHQDLWADLFMAVPICKDHTTNEPPTFSHTHCKVLYY